VIVYGLASSKDSVIRYVGQTSRDLKTRLQWHMTWTLKERDKSRRTAWIKSVLKSGHELLITPLQEGAERHVDEMKWIRRLKDEGIELVNGTLGGDSCIGVPKTEAHKAKIKAALTGMRRPWTAERNRQRRGLPGHAITPESKVKISLANTGILKPWLAELNSSRVWTDEMRARSGASRKHRKLEVEDVEEIKRLLSSGAWYMSTIALAFDVSYGSINAIKRGRSFKYVK
jgi:hypothetical protein